MTAFIDRTLTAIDPDGSRFELTLRIDAPREVDVDWACPVSLTPLFPKLGDIQGVDSWQALQLAQRLLFTLLEGFVERGGRLLHLDVPITPTELFVTAAPRPHTKV